MKKIWKYIAGFLTILGGILVAFFSGKDAGRSKERRKDIDKKLNIVKDALKSKTKYKEDVQKILIDKKKELEKIKKDKPKPKKKSAKKAHSRLKKIGKGKK